MKRPLPPVAPSPAPKGFIEAREVHPLLSGFPLTVMMLGALVVLFALTMTLSADADGDARASGRVLPVVRSVATRPVSYKRLLTPADQIWAHAHGVPVPGQTGLRSFTTS